MIKDSLFPAAKAGTTYVAPQIFVDCSHDMLVMSEETLSVWQMFSLRTLFTIAFSLIAVLCWA